MVDYSLINLIRIKDAIKVNKFKNNTFTRDDDVRDYLRNTTFYGYSPMNAYGKYDKHAQLFSKLIVDPLNIEVSHSNDNSMVEPLEPNENGHVFIYKFSLYNKLAESTLDVDILTDIIFMRILKLVSTPEFQCECMLADFTNCYLIVDVLEQEMKILIPIEDTFTATLICEFDEQLIEKLSSKGFIDKVFSV